MKSLTSFQRKFPIGRLFSVLLSASLLTACAAPPKVAAPKPPADAFDTVEVSVKMPPLSNLAKNTVQVPYSDVPVMSTVVISLSEKIDSGAALANARDEMQKELIRRGFRVLDPVQINGRLRELAMVGKCDGAQGWWRCASRLKAEEVRHLNEVKAAFDRGEIQQAQFAAEVDKYRRTWESRVTGARALREAIKAGKITVDFVLEVEAFSPSKQVARTLNLSKVADVRRFMRDYPDLQGALAKKQMMKCTGIGSEIQARLVNTKSSEVVWMGSHAVSDVTQVDSQYLVELGVRKYVANRDEVADYIAKNQGKLHKKSVAENMPGWRYRTALIGPRLLQGTCSLDGQTAESVQRVGVELSGQVARELVSTIRLVGQTPLPDAFSGSPAVAPPKKTNEVFLKDAAGPIRVR